MSNIDFFIRLFSVWVLAVVTIPFTVMVTRALWVFVTEQAKELVRNKGQSSVSDNVRSRAEFISPETKNK